MAEGGGLRRSIGLWRASSIVAGIIIGASIFVQPTEIIAAVHAPGPAIAVWFAAGLLTLVGAQVTAELSSAWPATGGVYVYLSRAFSPAVGFLWGWAMFWSMHTGIIAAIATVVATYAGRFVALDETQTRLVAIGAMVALSAINYRGVRHGASVQAALTAVKVLAIVGIIVMAFALGSPAPPPAAPPAPVTTDGVFAALVAGLFAYGGWHMVSYTAEETVDPTRTIPRALMIGTLGVTVLYVLVNAAYLYVLPADKVATSSRVAADVAEVVLGPAGARLVAALVMLSALGAMNGVILAGPRVYQAMAADGLLFRWASAVHPAYGTPHRAIVLQAAWAAVLIWTGSYRTLFTRVVYTEWIFFALLALATFVAVKRSDYRPRIRAWGRPLLPTLFIVASLAIVAQRVWRSPADAGFGLGLVVIGWPVYLIWTRVSGVRLNA